ncbi:MAG: glycosyltransferase [Bacteroidia bacterium]|nr:glycosyltransferase [Bacteroidia bacterium]
MPRILRIINRLNLGGPTYNVAFLTKFMDARYETQLVSGAIDDTEASSNFILDKYNLKPVYVSEMKRAINPKDDYLAYQKIKKIIKEFKPDIVHTHMAKPGTVGRLAALHCKVPVILHTFHGHYFHSYFSSTTTKLFLQIERYLAAKTNGIVVLSEVQKKELSETYKVCKPQNTYIIPLGFDLSRFTHNMSEKRKQFRLQHKLNNTIAIGIIGRLVPVKNHQLFIKAFHILLKSVTKPVHAFIIGDGELRQQIEEMCKNQGLVFNTPTQYNNQANLTFTSWIQDVDIALAGLDIVALTSLNEGTPVSLIEAQAASKAIVSTQVGGIENVVIPGKSALLSTSNDVNAFAQNLITLVNDDMLRDQMSNWGLNHVNSQFNYTRLVSDMTQLYDKLLGI